MGGSLAFESVCVDVMGLEASSSCPSPKEKDVCFRISNLLVDVDSLEQQIGNTLAVVGSYDQELGSLEILNTSLEMPTTFVRLRKAELEYACKMQARVCFSF
jgi:hypothetical protein